MYNSNELNEYFNLFESIDIALTEEDKERIKYYCGGHPYLLAALGFEIVETFKENGHFNIKEIFDKMRLDFEDYYEQLITLLKEDGTFEKMLQILFGPMLNVTEGDVKELRDIYGLLEEINLPNNDKTLVAFLQHFQEYLSNLGRKIDFWPLWTTLEITLRKLITTIFKEKHGDKWEDKLIELFPVLFNGLETGDRKIEGAIQKKAKAKEDYKSDNLLDYIDAQPLFELMFTAWNDYFKDIFGDKNVKAELAKKIQLITKVRNPYAHSRFHSISPTTVQQAEIYCKEILEQLNR